MAQQNAANAEASASAAEEMNSQDDQMKAITDELAALVGGGKQRPSGTLAPAAATQSLSFGASAPERGKAKALAANNQEKVPPEQIIPLDDAFDDF